MRQSLVFVAVVASIVGCRSSPNDATALFSSSVRWVDLTHPFDSAAIYWPTADPFELEEVSAGYTPQGYYYAANNFRAAEHGGTHLDAPIHFAEGQHTADQIPLQRFVGPAVVIDASEHAAKDSDYRIGIADLDAYERGHGTIPVGAIVLLHTGWGDRWPDAAAYLGTARRGPEAIPSLHFPGLHPDAARWLLTERQIDAVGIDTPSIDYGQSTSFETHRALFAENVPVFENVANLSQMPMAGAYVVALPMKIKGGTGGPLRIVGVVPGS